MLSFTEIEDILKSGDFSKLKDQFESELIDVKSQIYDFSNTSKDNKYELCKDVSAFANNKGGFILLGVAGQKLQGKPHEKIVSVVGINVADINQQQYVQHLENGIYPKLASECSLEFSKLDGKDVFYIKVNENSNNKPYLVRKDNYFSYIIRTETHGLQEPLDRIHEIMRHGLHHELYISGMDKKLNELLEVVRKEQIVNQPVMKSSNIEELLKEL